MTSDLVLLGLRVAGCVATIDPTVWLGLATGMVVGFSLMSAVLWILHGSQS